VVTGRTIRATRTRHRSATAGVRRHPAAGTQCAARTNRSDKRCKRLVAGSGV